MNAFKDWKTTLSTIIGAVLIVLGMFLPEKFDPETQEVITTSLNEILVGLGALINVITGIVAKDPE